MAVASIEVFTEIVSLNVPARRCAVKKSRPSSLKAGNACCLL